MAHGMRADYIEQDIVLSKDDVPVVLHDTHLDTTTDVATRYPQRRREDGRYYALDFTLAELKQLRVKERFSPKTGERVYPRRYPHTELGFRISTLQEELEMIAGMNQSTGYQAGIYPEIKSPSWHREQGHDISPIVLKLLREHGYEGKEKHCFLQCFELKEVQRLRGELGWKGQLIMLLGGSGKLGADGTDYARLLRPEGLKELALLVDGIGPSIGSLLSGGSPATRKVSDLCQRAHEHGLKVHPYTLRMDELPKCVTSGQELMQLLFHEAQVDGLFTDFPDVAVTWLREQSQR